MIGLGWYSFFYTAFFTVTLILSMLYAPAEPLVEASDEKTVGIIMAILFLPVIYYLFASIKYVSQVKKEIKN